MTTETKRQNFNITPEQEAELAHLRDVLEASSIKDAILRAVRIVGALSQETRRGGALYLQDASGRQHRVLIPELEPTPTSEWRFLASHAHPWRRQLYVKGRKLLAATVWMDMRVNKRTLGETADNWDLPIEAVAEIVRYCEQNEPLLRMEADEERRRLSEGGLSVEPDPTLLSRKIAGAGR